MIMFSATQVLHLPLDAIENGKVVDSSGKGNDGTAQGTPQILPDDTLGACLSLDGSTQYIDVPPASVPSGNEITVSFWAYGGDALPKNCAIIEATDARGITTLSIRLPWGDSTVYFNCGNDGSNIDSIAQAAQPADFKGTWTHWAFTKNAATGDMHIYRNGTLWLSGIGKTRPLPATTIVKVGATADGNNRYQGKIAHVRVYSQALAVADIARDMEADQTALSSFRKSYPIDFRLYNDDEQEVLDITDDPEGQNLHLEVSNASGQVINLIAPGNSTASANNYHFALRFRPDTLSFASQTYTSFAAHTLQTLAASPPQGVPQQDRLAQAFLAFVASAPPTVQPPTAPSTSQAFVATTTPAPQAAQPPAAAPSALQTFAVATASALQVSLQQQGWNIGYQQEPSGSVVVYFLSTQARSLAPGAKVAVTLPHVSAGGAGGARGTRIELLYQQMTFSSDITPISGRRQVYLSIVNQRGQKRIPLHASFVGFNTILNDGQAQNSLILRITNTLKDSPISLNPAGSSAPSKFILSFDVQADNETGTSDWALGTASQVRAIEVTLADVTDASNWMPISPSGQEQSPEWTLTPQSSKTVLTEEKPISLKLANIITSLPPGQTNLYIDYKNIPGYWDGQLVVIIEKTPLLYRGSNVGIGTNTPDRPLTIRASGPTEELISFEDVTGKTSWHINQHSNSSGLNVVETAVANSRLFIQVGGNVGIGTTAPSRPLAIRASGPAQELISFEDVSGKTKWHINQYPNGTGLNVVETDVADGRLFIQAGGNIGVGTTTPAAKLTVSASAQQQHLQLRREATEQTGDKLLFLELYQDENNPPTVPEVHPSIRFHHHNRFWQRIEGRADGIHFKTGDLSSDSDIDIFAGSGHFSGNIGIGAGNSIQQGINFTASSTYRLNDLGSFNLPLNTPNAIRIVGGGGGVLAVNTGDVLCWTPYGVVIKGGLWAENKYFLIDHPTRPDHNLIHASLEGPESGVYYRGQAQLEDGRATIRLPDYFEALTRQEGRTVLLTPKGREPFLLSHEDIVDGIFKVYGTRADGAFSWEVKAVRADVGRLETEVRK